MNSAEGPLRTSAERGIFVIYLRGEGHFWYFTFIFSTKPVPPLWSPTGPPFLVIEDESTHRLSAGFSDSISTTDDDDSPTAATDDDDETGFQDPLPAVEMDENLPNILSDGLGSRIHSAVGYISPRRTLRGVNQCSTKYRKGAPRRVEVYPQRILHEMTYSLRGVNQCSTKYRKEGPRRLEVYPQSLLHGMTCLRGMTLKVILWMHIPHGDPLLVHLMTLHEVRTQEVFEMGRFLFDIEGRHLEFGETEYILIYGLKVGRYVDLLYDEKGGSNSSLRARLFPDISDVRLRLKDLEDFIMSPKYLEIENEDVVMLIQLVFVLKGLHGHDVCMGYIWILETFLEATKFYVRIPTELPRMRCWRSKSALSWENYS
ncbi:hypothetical protein Lser_V15G20435 [Lactuca serriola]